LFHHLRTVILIEEEFKGENQRIGGLTGVDLWAVLP
jgi:hypothetical protein